MFQTTMRRTSVSNDDQSVQAASHQSFKPSAHEESALKQQEDMKRDREQDARTHVREAEQRMRHEAELKTVEFQRQSLEGSVRKIDEILRNGVTAQEVAEQVKQRTLGGLDYDLSKLTPPSFTRDERGKIREAYMRAVDNHAKTIEAEQLQHREKLETEQRVKLEGERRETGVVLSS